MPDDLIARLEATTEGSREMDAELWFATHKTPEGTIPLASSLEDAKAAVKEARVSADGSIPHHTTSLDAAMTLDPPGIVHTRSYWYADGTHAEEQLWFGDDQDEAGHRIYKGWGKTRPTARCAAALKARAAEEDVEEDVNA